MQLYNGATPIGPVVSVPANGTWTTTLSGLSANTTYSLKARALYGTGQESAVWTVNVAAVVSPTIDSICDSKGQLANPGTTFDTSVTLTGKATGGLTVQLYNGATPIGPVINVPANGTWTTTLSGLSVNTSYNIKVKALYDIGEESRTWTLMIESSIAIEDFETLDVPNADLNLQLPCQLPHMTIVSGEQVWAAKNGWYPGKITGNYIYINGSGATTRRIRIELKRPCTTISFWYRSGGTYPLSIFVEFFDINNNRLDYFSLKDIYEPELFSFSGVNIKYINLTVMGIPYFDNFTLHWSR
ncbi:Ig-like domain repeat protein [Pseudomonas frederiksbergensis]|uniref:Fibronectin type-III domain-containing protein n=1 Tax=Pseudomonas frederiksbergensis TaxID=104087 RepID=A0A423KDI7_9PSED|nr:Ig-like domain repeat protein [Pseudomonas frederiksbergensis]RON50392.1 hypothetical protein BK665_21670 [Pseudomonas frederiksbergensis]